MDASLVRLLRVRSDPAAARRGHRGEFDNDIELIVLRIGFIYSIQL